MFSSEAVFAVFLQPTARLNNAAARMMRSNTINPMRMPGNGKPEQPAFQHTVSLMDPSNETTVTVTISPGNFVRTTIPA